MKREKDEPSTANLTYYHDDPAVGYGTTPTENVVGAEKPATDYRAPAVNHASNF
jgi:hypothetical protein